MMFFLLAPGGGGWASIFWGQSGGANLFFCPPDVIFISDDHIINATSPIEPDLSELILE